MEGKEARGKKEKGREVREKGRERKGAGRGYLPYHPSLLPALLGQPA